MYDPEKAQEARDAVEERTHELSEFLARAFRANIYDHPHKKLSREAEHIVDLFSTVAAEALVSHRGKCPVCNDDGPVDGGVCGGCGVSYVHAKKEL